jgi:hypothetical protein
MVVSITETGREGRGIGCGGEELGAGQGKSKSSSGYAKFEGPQAGCWTGARRWAAASVEKLGGATLPPRGYLETAGMVFWLSVIVGCYWHYWEGTRESRWPAKRHMAGTYFKSSWSLKCPDSLSHG